LADDMRVLYLFSEYYPYGDESMSEHAFINNEIRYLSQKFDKVVVVPSLLLGSLQPVKSFEVDPSLGGIMGNASKLKIVAHALANKFFYREMISKPVSFWNPAKLKRLVYFTGRAGLVKKWLEQKLNQSIFPQNTLFYTFWLTEVTLGLVRVKGVQVISRAHGHDLYEEYYGYIPCFGFILKLLHRLYLVSKPAVNYLTDKYPGCSTKLERRYLGVKKALGVSDFSKDGLVRIVSCSYLIKRKRVDLLVRGLQEFVNTHQRPVLWIHFGDGPEFERIQSMVSNMRDELFNYELKGNTANKDILNYYQNNPVEIFIHLSESEGGVPVAIQEAQAHGIPVIGTSAGGIPEIVNKDVGVLLDENPKPAEIAYAIHYIVSDTARFHRMRENSVRNWRNNFNEEVNFKQFADEIALIDPFKGIVKPYKRFK
jgi:colanic acid/amylovoran biosynthesis glycosyltransferase